MKTGLLRPCAGVLLAAVCSGAAELRWVRQENQPEGAFVEVSALSGKEWERVKAGADWKEVLVVRAEPEALQLRPDLPAMIGGYEVNETSLRFVPRFPLVPGVRYRAVFRPAGLADGGKAAKSVSAAYQFEAAPGTAATRVAAVYPSAAVLPSNLLKVYLHFSAPMSRGEVYERVRVLDAGGKALELPFLELEEELWNAEQTRLTLLLDPGRIKRGLLPLEQAGPVFAAGQSYTLVVDAAWRDGNRAALAETYRKTFSIGEADLIAPDPARWQLTPPKAGTVEPLVVRFDEAMDSALVRRLMWVETNKGGVVEGRIELSDDDRCWNFTPAQAWSSGPGVVRIQTLVEDLAGNQIGKAFDVDVFENEAPGAKVREVSLAFAVK
jgi:hypothetical protein